MPPGGQRGRMLAASRATQRRAGPVARAVAAAGRGLAAVHQWWLRTGWRSRLTVSAASGAVLLAGVALWAGSGSGPVPRARQYLAFTACLLTGSNGLADPKAAQVWSGMQAASLTTHAKVEYLPVMSGNTAAAATPYVASLVQRQCQVVIATGQAQATAVTAAAKRFPKVRFAVAGVASTSGRVAALPPSPPALRSAVEQIITAAVSQAN